MTTVAAVHTEFLGSLEGVREEKGGLVRAIAADGVVVLNADDPRVLGDGARARARVVTYGRAGTAPTSRRSARSPDDDEGLRFTPASAGGERQAVTLALAGRHNVANALAAAAVGAGARRPTRRGRARPGAARPAAGAAACGARRAACAILDDTYNANPVSVRAALDDARAQAPGGAGALVVLGDMLELGDISEAAHREVGRHGRRAARPRSSSAVGSAIARGGRGGAGRRAVPTSRHFDDASRTRSPTCSSALARGDRVLVKGSRGMRMERAVEALMAGSGAARRMADALPLLVPLAKYHIVFNVFRYITFRTAMALVTALVISLCLGPWLIRTAPRAPDGETDPRGQAGASPGQGGDADHGRAPDPRVAILARRSCGRTCGNRYVWVVLLATVGLGLIGFCDDWRKLRTRRACSDAGEVPGPARGGRWPSACSSTFWPPDGVTTQLAMPFFKGWLLDLGWPGTSRSRRWSSSARPTR